MLIFATIADTTWRMFVPVLAGVLGGLWIDNQLGTKPLYTFIGLGVGVLLAALLVWAQLRKVLGGRS